MNIYLLTPKTNKGRNRVREAQRKLADWDGTQWQLILPKYDRVLFSDKKGPWLLLSPISAYNYAKEAHGPFSRWVHEHTDDNFTVSRKDW